MSKLSLWQPHKGKNFSFIDKIAREQYYVGSVGIFVHKYEGVIEQDSSSISDDITTIQDITFVENRNRKYSDDVFELRGFFTEADKDFELFQFNIGIASGSKFISFHLNDIINKLGRKLMAGDVLELPNLRDDAILNSPASNQWYVVSDASWPAEGFSATWFPHLWRVKVNIMTDSPEYSDITKDADGKPDPLIDMLSTYNKQIENNDAVIADANLDVPYRNFETRQFYVIPNDEFGSQHPWVWAGDGIPPNHSHKADSGSAFPDSPVEKSYFLRTDYNPARLFQHVGNIWKYVEIDFRRTFESAHRTLESFINNDNTFDEDGHTVKERQPISKIIKPRSDF